MLYKISKDFVIDARDRKAICSMSNSHSHQYNEIYFMQEGTCDVWIEEKKYHLEAGCVLFIPAYLSHKFVYQDHTTVKRTILYLSTEQLKWYFQDYHIDEITNLFDYRLITYSKKSATTINGILKKILLEKYNLDELSEPLTKSYFFELFIFLIRCHKYSDHMNQKTDLSNIEIGNILKYIDEHYYETLSLPTLAKQFGLSESSLSKKFKTFTGINFKEYLNRIRIDASKHLLMTTNKNITEIAYMSGYNNSNFFGDTFKKIVGMSPSCYRKILTEE